MHVNSYWYPERLRTIVYYTIVKESKLCPELTRLNVVWIFPNILFYYGKHPNNAFFLDGITANFFIVNLYYCIGSIEIHYLP